MMNDHLLKRRRPHHTGDRYLFAPTFGLSDFNPDAASLAPNAVPAADAGLYMLSPEDPVLAALYKSLDFGIFDTSLDNASANLNARDSAIFGSGNTYGSGIVTQNNILPQQQLQQNTRKRRRSEPNDDMPLSFFSNDPSVSEKASAAQWQASPSTASSDSCVDLSCLEGNGLLPCFPLGSLAWWTGYQPLPEPARGVYGDGPVPGLAGDPQPSVPPTLQAPFSEPPELSHPMVSLEGAQSPSTPIYPDVAPAGSTQTASARHLVPDPSIALFPKPSLHSTVPTSQVLDICSASAINSGLEMPIIGSYPLLDFSTESDLFGSYPVPPPDAAVAPLYVTESLAVHSSAPAQHETLNKNHVYRDYSVPIAVGRPKPRTASNPETVYPTPGSVVKRAQQLPQPALVGAPLATNSVRLASPQQKHVPNRRGPFTDTVARERTAQTRKMGSCIRCKMQRIRCEFDENTFDFGPCITCQRVSGTKIWRLPCLRYKLTDIRLHKPGQVRGYEWTARWKDHMIENISLWASNETKYIDVSQGFMTVLLRLRVRKFLPQPGDKLTRTWVWNGTAKSVDIPPYAIADIGSIEAALVDMIEPGILECVETLMREQGGLLRETYLRAWVLSQDPRTSPDDRDLLMDAFRLWVAIRLGTRSEFIVGTETLGMSRDILDETSPLHGKIPLPPVMSAQMDLVLNQHLILRLRKRLLLRLQKMSQASHSRNWLVLYLVFFILLDNAAMMFHHDQGYAKKHGMKRRFAREDTVAEYHHGANVILAYFHYCNKGIYPFSRACKDGELRSLADLDDDWISFVKYTRTEVQKHAGEWADARARKDYGHRFFFISQIFEEQWQPKSFEV